MFLCGHDNVERPFVEPDFPLRCDNTTTVAARLAVVSFLCPQRDNASTFHPALFAVRGVITRGQMV